jgi:AcrR family transcriptional regulator
MNGKRERILHSAFHLFTTRGFHDTPTSLIAREAGVANGTLFNHFATKEDLINQLYLASKESLVTAMQEKVDPKEDIRSQILTIWRNSMNWALKNPEQFHFFQQYSNSPFILTETREEGRQQFAPFIRILEKGIETQALKPVSIDLMLTIISGIISSTVEVLLRGAPGKPSREIMEKAFLMLWDSIRK